MIGSGSVISLPTSRNVLGNAARERPFRLMPPMAFVGHPQGMRMPLGDGRLTFDIGTLLPEHTTIHRTGPGGSLLPTSRAVQSTGAIPAIQRKIATGSYGQVADAALEAQKFWNLKNFPQRRGRCRDERTRSEACAVCYDGPPKI